MFVPQIHIRNKRTVFWKRDDPKRFVYLFAVIISRICRDSGQIDRDLFLCRLFDECKQDLIAEIAQSPADGERVLDVLMIAKYLERIGDHATNIAEWVEFSITGTHKSETHV